MQFSRDRRGQSVVIGTVILFGFLIIGLSLYQVQVVPQQNAQTEFEHAGNVQNDLVDLRAGILQAGSTDRTQYQTVRLGTSYSTRVFAINPPPPAGEIRTSDSYNITIDPNSGDPINVSTRFVQYRPGYSELDRSPTWYDASVLYSDASDSGGGIAVIEGQELVDNDENVNIVAVQNEFQRSGTGRVTMELRPAESVTGDIPDGPLTVTIPTRLSKADWETKTDITEKDAYNNVTSDNNGDGIYNLTLNTTAENLTVDTVGVGEAPEDATQNDNRDGDTDEESDLPQGFVAYDDVNGNGVYDGGTDTPYTADEIGDTKLDGMDIIIERDVTTDRIQQNQFASLVIEDGVTVETTSGKLTFEIKTVGGFINASGATLRVPNGNEVRLRISKGDGNIDIEDAQLRSDGNIKVQSKSGSSTLSANDNGPADGGTYVVKTNGDPADLLTKKIDTSDAELEVGDFA